MRLTGTAIRNAKAQPKVTKHSDGGGLQLWVTPAGAKLWRLAYGGGFDASPGWRAVRDERGERQPPA